MITIVLNAKIGEVENKIPDASGLINKTDYNTEISDIEAKYFTTDYNKVTSEILETKIKQKGFVDKSSISNLVKGSDLNTKFATLATKAELIAQNGNIEKMQAFN